MSKKFIESRVYLKPLLPGEMGDTDAVLKRVKADLLRRIRRELMQTAFSDRAKRALSKAIKIETGASSLRITANHPAFAPLIRGQKKEQMRWLAKARAPIPIIREDGTLIFRNATARSLADGRWVHPGRAASTFIDRAKDTSRAFLKKKLKEEFLKKIRSAWKR